MKWMKIIILLLTFFVVNNSSSQNLKEGDLLFQHLSCGDFCDAIEKVTPAYQNTHFSHVAIVVKKNQNQWLVAEAINKGVSLTDLDTFIARSGKENIYVGRVKNNYFIPKIIDIEPYIGKPYDTVFDISNKAYYCSELVYFLYKDKKKGHPIFKLNPMTFKDPETNDYFSAWVEYFNKMNVPIPENKPGLNPGSMINQTEIYEKIFPLRK
jgi:hypothetical protein